MAFSPRHIREHIRELAEYVPVEELQEIAKKAERLQEEANRRETEAEKLCSRDCYYCGKSSGCQLRERKAKLKWEAVELRSEADKILSALERRIEEAEKQAVVVVKKDDWGQTEMFFDRRERQYYKYTSPRFSVGGGVGPTPFAQDVGGGNWKVVPAASMRMSEQEFKKWIERKKVESCEELAEVDGVKLVQVLLRDGRWDKVTVEVHEQEPPTCVSCQRYITGSYGTDSYGGKFKCRKPWGCETVWADPREWVCPMYTPKEASG